MSAMSEGDRAIFREEAFEVAEIVGQRIAEKFIAHIKEHSLTCDTKKKVERWENRFKGLLIGVGLCGVLAGFSGAVALWKLLTLI